MIKEFEVHAAVKKKDYELLRTLVNRGADVDARKPWSCGSDHLRAGCDCGATPLHLAVIEKNIPMIKFLLSRGANILAEDDLGKSPLQHAFDRCDFDVIRLMIKYSGDVNARGQHGQTALHWASLQSDIPTIDYLLSLGADVNVRDTYDDFTPLHYVCLKTLLFNDEVAKYLLKSGADVNAVDKAGNTPLNIVLQRIENSQNHSYRKEYVNVAKNILRYSLEFCDSKMSDPMMIEILKNSSIQYLKRIVVEHVAKSRETVNRHVLLAIFENDESRDHFKECRRELELAGNLRISNFAVNFLDILLKKNLRNYVGIEHLVEEAYANDWLGRFPIYGCLMRQNIGEEIERRKSLDEPVTVLTNQLPVLRSPRDTIIEDILDCMDKRLWPSD